MLARLELSKADLDEMAKLPSDIRGLYESLSSLRGKIKIEVTIENAQLASVIIHLDLSSHESVRLFYASIYGPFVSRVCYFVNSGQLKSIGLGDLVSVTEKKMESVV